MFVVLYGSIVRVQRCIKRKKEQSSLDVTIEMLIVSSINVTYTRRDEKNGREKVVDPSSSWMYFDLKRRGKKSG